MTLMPEETSHEDDALFWLEKKVLNSQRSDAGLLVRDLSRMGPLLTEMQILRHWDKSTLIGGQPVTMGRFLGTTMEHHFIRYLSLLIPSLVPDPWFQEKVWSFFDTRRRGRQITNWFGSQNSGKTNCLSAMAIAFGCLHPAHTRQIAATPYKNVGESPLIGEFEVLFDEVRLTHGEMLLKWSGGSIDKRGKWVSNKEKTSIVMESSPSRFVYQFSESPKAGTFTLVAVDKAVAKIQGAKAKDRNQKDGYFILWADEIGAGYPTTDVLRVLPNVCSNANFHMVTACNPLNPTGQLDGELGHPANGFESLKIDEDVVWDSAHGSRTYRFDGHRSPNFLLPGDPYPWLFNEERKKKLLSRYAPDSREYNSQCRAFMPEGTGNRFVLTTSDLLKGMVEAEFEFTHDPKWHVAFVDPSLSSDGDSTVYCKLEGGFRREVDHTIHPVVYAHELIHIPIFTDKVADEEWVQLCQRIRGPRDNNHKLGQIIPVEEYLALTVARQLQIDRVPYHHFGYDDSMRSRVTLAMIWAMGDGPMAVSSVGEPDATPVYPAAFNVDENNKRTPVTWRDDCVKFVSQLNFFAAAVIRGGDFRASRGTMVALKQATRRFWRHQPGGKKRVVESKKEYKDRNQGASPDEWDALSGALHVAHKRGLIKLNVDRPALIWTPPAHRQSVISRQWKNRKPVTGLHATGTRA